MSTGPTASQLRARALALTGTDTGDTQGGAATSRSCQGPHDGIALASVPASVRLEHACLACNREAGAAMCDLCQRLENAAKAGAK